MRVVYILLDEIRESRFAGQGAETLPPAYRRRIADMTSTAARARSTAGLWLLREALADVGRAAAWPRIGFSATGRPEIAGGPCFSISHSGALVACALADDRPLGLDVEQRRASIASRLIRTIAPDGEDFFSAWCAREATVKASGRVGLARIRAIRLDAGIAWLDDRAWSLAPIVPVTGYAGCIAVETETETGTGTAAPNELAAPVCEDLGGRL